MFSGETRRTTFISTEESALIICFSGTATKTFTCCGTGNLASHVKVFTWCSGCVQVEQTGTLLNGAIALGGKMKQEAIFIVL